MECVFTNMALTQCVKEKVAPVEWQHHVYGLSAHPAACVCFLLLQAHGQAGMSQAGMSQAGMSQAGMSQAGMSQGHMDL